MKKTDLTFRDLIGNNQKLTFLVGAGCSVDPPSCLPAGQAMMEAIIKYTCAESEQEKILDLVLLGTLRFEGLVEIIRDTLDKELKIIDYYGLCNKPNIQHFFLAEMINKGHFVMTTNFDFLIEYALKQSGVPDSEIIPVITKRDFKKFNNPKKLFRKNKKTVYKIHGSTKNIITGENTRDSLVATIQAFGSNKEGQNIFQMEPFKQPLFQNISEGRSLVVIGYSGSDDFDVVPTLKVLKNIKNVIWINFVEDDWNKETIFEIDHEEVQSSTKSNKTNEILKDIRRMDYVEHVYRVDVNTLRLVNNLIDKNPNIDSNIFGLNLAEWLRNNIETPLELKKLYIPHKIFFDFNRFDYALRCGEKIREVSEKSKNSSWLGLTLNNNGEIYRQKGDNGKALVYFTKALEISTSLDNLSGKATCLNNIGKIYAAKEDYNKALENYKKALKIDKHLNNPSGKANRLNNIGEIYYKRKKYGKALKKFEKALKIVEKLGNLSRKATCLNSIGLIYAAKENYSGALENYRKALKIDEHLFNLSGKASRLNNIGSIYNAREEYDLALEYIGEARNIAEQLGTLSPKATYLKNLGLIFEVKEEYDRALKFFNECFQIFNSLGKKKSAEVIRVIIKRVKKLGL